MTNPFSKGIVDGTHLGCVDSMPESPSDKCRAPVALLTMDLPEPSLKCHFAKKLAPSSMKTSSTSPWKPMLSPPVWPSLIVSGSCRLRLPPKGVLTDPCGTPSTKRDVAPDWCNSSISCQWPSAKDSLVEIVVGPTSTSRPNLFHLISIGPADRSVIEVLWVEYDVLN